MSAPLNQLLFYLSMLFYSPVTFISQETDLSFNLSENKLELTFYHLETPEKEAELAKPALLQIDTARQIDAYLADYTPGFKQLKLRSKELKISKKQLDAHISFSFTNAEKNLNAFGIYQKDNKYWYAIREKEKVLNTNGKVIREEGQKYIVWEDGVETIQFQLKHQPLDDPILQDLVNAKAYWE